MDTERLRYFLSIARFGSLAEASGVLRISSPALSKSMRVLEAEVGMQLFIRTGGKVLLSDEGRRLVPLMEDILMRISALRQDPRDSMSEARPILRLATFEVFSTHLVGPLVASLPRDYEMELFEAIPGEMERLIAEGHADVGLTYLPIPWNGIEFIEITTAPMGIFGKKSLWEGMELAQLPFAVPLNPLASVPTKARGLDGWPEDRLPRWRKYRVSMMESALELCRQGLAVAYLPKFVVRLHNLTVTENHRLEEISGMSPQDKDQGVYLVKRQGAPESPLMRKVAVTVRRICTSLWD